MLGGRGGTHRRLFKHRAVGVNIRADRIQEIGTLNKLREGRNEKVRIVHDGVILMREEGGRANGDGR